jgi:UDP-N-acetyl-D-glucosamine dehydrogenase
VAEMTKLLENTFRAVNIGLINEIAKMSNKMGIDVWEVIESAATKPFGFMPFYPGPGLGGHCIPLDPLYLSWKAKMNGFNPRFIELADEINSSMPAFVVSKISDALNKRRKSIHGSKVLILGFAYKKNVGDIRESPALEIAKLLINKGAEICYNDPYISSVNINGIKLTSLNLSMRLLNSMDCVVIVTGHDKYNYRNIIRHSRLVIDTRNATKDITTKKPNIIKL